MSNTPRYNSTKVKPKPVYFDGKKFASLLERDVYYNLKNHSKVTDLVCQDKVIVLPKTDKIKAKTWKVDFRFTYDGTTIVWLEAKGLIDSSFTSNVRALASNNKQVYSRLILAAPLPTISRSVAKIRSLYIPYLVADRIASRLSLTVAQLEPQGKLGIEEQLKLPLLT